ncbi:hypothetical protein ACWCOP_03535 [Maricaulaceae bacterium MS644]
MSLLYQILGALLVLFGLPLFWTPIPIGLIMIASGLALIISNSNAAREWVRTQRLKHPRFDAWLHQAEARVPHPFDRILKQTEARRAGASEDDESL